MFIISLVIIFCLYPPQIPIPSACLELYNSPSNLRCLSIVGCVEQGSFLGC